jgi:hypothetical protein
MIRNLAKMDLAGLEKKVSALIVRMDSAVESLRLIKSAEA